MILISSSPRAMLSDFGTSQDMLKSRARSGNTGTYVMFYTKYLARPDEWDAYSLEYSSPESLPSPTGQLLQVDSKSDMWSVGMILHKLLFFKLPYASSSDNTRDGREASDALEREVQAYAGYAVYWTGLYAHADEVSHSFKSSPSLQTVFESRRLPKAYLWLLEGLLNINPSIRPSSDRVLGAIREGRVGALSASLMVTTADRVRHSSTLSARAQRIQAGGARHWSPFPSGVSSTPRRPSSTVRRGRPTCTHGSPPSLTAPLALRAPTRPPEKRRGRRRSGCRSRRSRSTRAACGRARCTSAGGRSRCASRA